MVSTKLAVFSFAHICKLSGCYLKISIWKFCTMVSKNLTNLERQTSGSLYGGRPHVPHNEDKRETR